MSQAKVNEYKNYKKNRKKILAKERRRKTAAAVAVRLAVLAVVAGVLVLIGIWGMGRYRAYLDSRPDYSSTGYLLGDISGITLVDETKAPENETEPETEPESPEVTKAD